MNPISVIIAGGKRGAETSAAKAEKLPGTDNELQETKHQLKVARAQMMQLEKMALLGQLVAEIAHEISNPLSFSLNNLYTAESNLRKIGREDATRLSEASLKKLIKVQSQLGNTKEGLERVRELILGLRRLSRFDEAEIKTIDVHESIDMAILFLQPKIKGRIELEKQYKLARPLHCFAGQLNQVFVNLVANAVEAIEGPGKIVIATDEAGGHACITVRDSGPGIPEAVRRRIFEPFFTTKRTGYGTGLGLAISHDIIQAHKGILEVESEEGRGTEFKIKLPLDFTRTDVQ